MAYNPIPPVGQDDMAGSLPVVIASDQSAVTVDLGVNNDVTVTGTVTANAGTNLNTSALALESGGNLATIAGDTTAIQTAVELLDDTVYTDGAGTPSKGILALGTDGTNPQAIKTDASGELQVDVLSMPSTTVTATDLDIRNLVNTDVVTAELSAVDNAVLDAIEADTTTLAGAVSGTEMQVDVVTSALPSGASTLAEQQSQTTHLATIAGDTTAIQTSVELMDDTVTAQGTALGTTKTILNGASVTTAAPTYTTGQISPLNMATTGALRVDIGATSANATAVKVNVASGGIASGAIASGAIASGAIASGAIAAGAIAAGATSIATTEDTACAAADHLVKVAAIRRDTPVANANVSNDGDYTQFALDNMQKLWTADNQSEDAAHTSGDRGSFMLGVRQDTPNTALTNTDGDYSGVSVNKLGEIRTAIPEADLATAATNHVKKYYTNAGAVTDGIIWSPAAGKRWFVTDIIINTSAAATVTLEDDLTAGDSVVMKFELAANSGVSHTFNTPLYSGEDAADLLVTTSAGNIYITVTGYEI